LFHAPQTSIATFIRQSRGGFGSGIAHWNLRNQVHVRLVARHLSLWRSDIASGFGLDDAMSLMENISRTSGW